MSNPSAFDSFNCSVQEMKAQLVRKGPKKKEDSDTNWALLTYSTCYFVNVKSNDKHYKHHFGWLQQQRGLRALQQQQVV